MRGAARAGDLERGAGTVLVLGIVAVAVVLALALAAIGGAQRARGTAQAAADLGALAAATVLQRGGDPCAAAGDAVARNHGRLASCVPEGAGIVEVKVTVPVTFAPFLPGAQAEAHARAGPRPG